MTSSSPALHHSDSTDLLVPAAQPYGSRPSVDSAVPLPIDYYQPRARDFSCPPSLYSTDEVFPDPVPRQHARRALPADGNDVPAHKAGRHGIFASEDEYLAALRQWIEEKAYTESVNSKGHSNALIGFYGQKTMQDYLKQPAPELRIRRRKEKVVQEEAGAGRRASAGVGGEEDAGCEVDGTLRQRQTRRKSSLGQWLGRRRIASVARGE